MSKLNAVLLWLNVALLWLGVVLTFAVMVQHYRIVESQIVLDAWPRLDRLEELAGCAVDHCGAFRRPRP